MAQDIDITHLPIGELKPDPANPRRISDEELERPGQRILQFPVSEQAERLLQTDVEAQNAT